MNEIVLIRLGSSYQEPIFWLVFSTKDQSVKASGVFNDAEELGQLKTWSEQRKLIVLAPGCDFLFKQIDFPGRLTPKALQALPFVFEDLIASDAESLHVTILAKNKAQLDLCAVDKAQLKAWMSWLDDANLKVEGLYPDVLALPCLPESKWYAMQLGEQWLFRQSQYSGVVIDQPLLSAWVQLLENQPTVISATPLPDETLPGQWDTELHDFPLSLLAQNLPDKRYSVIQGVSKQADRKSIVSTEWISSLVLCGLLLSVFAMNQIIDVMRYSSQLEQSQKEMTSFYRKTFPNEKRVINPYVQFKQHLTSAGDVSNNHFFSLMSALGEVVRQHQGCQVLSLQYDQKKSHLIVQMSCASFKDFQTLKAAIPDEYQADVGQMTEQNGAVQGTLTLSENI